MIHNALLNTKHLTLNFLLQALLELDEDLDNLDLEDIDTTDINLDEEMSD